MNGKNTFPQLDIYCPMKLSICYNISLIQPIDIYYNDPINKLIFEYSDIENIKKISDFQITQFLYFNRKSVHKLLYDLDQNIHFDYEEINNNLSFYFYLLLLINDIPEILNYTFNPIYIKKINNLKRNNDEKVKNIIISKIIIELIYEIQKTYDYFEDENEKKIIEMINNNLDIIENNIQIFKELEINLTKDDICKLKIDKIYINIINILIKNKKFEDYNFMIIIIKQLDIENIKLTKTMIDELLKILNSNEKYINDYILINEEDFSNQRKINFYFILIKYILKNSIYIYQIPFLLKTRNNIKKIIKSKKEIYSINRNNSIEDRAEYIIKIFTNSDKHFKRKKKQSNLNSIIMELIKNKTESKKSISIEKSIKKNKENEKGKQINNDKITEKSIYLDQSNDIGEKPITAPPLLSNIKLEKNPFIKINNIYKSINSELVNFGLSVLDGLYNEYKVLFSDEFKGIIKDLVKSPEKIDQFYIQFLESVEKGESNKEIKINGEVSKNINQIHLLIESFKPLDYLYFLFKYNFYIIDPYEEINDIKNDLPKNANSESVKIFSELIS